MTAEDFVFLCVLCERKRASSGIVCLLLLLRSLPFFGGKKIVDVVTCVRARMWQAHVASSTNSNLV